MVLSGISPTFAGLSPSRGQITHVLRTRSPLYLGAEAPFLARLACVRHAASVRSEPGSNSPLKLAKENPSPLVLTLQHWYRVLALSLGSREKVIYCLAFKELPALCGGPDIENLPPLVKRGIFHRSLEISPLPFLGHREG